MAKIEEKLESKLEKNDFLAPADQPMDNRIFIPRPAGGAFFTFSNFSKILPWLCIVLVMAGAGIWFGLQYNVANQQAEAETAAQTPPVQTAEEQTNAAIEKIGKLMVLPDNELPDLATITDPSKLSNHPFFSKAEKGDKVLIYNAAKKAILYSERLNKIVDVSPITQGDALKNSQEQEGMVAGSSTTEDENSNSNEIRP